jgi:TolB-like protein/Flp pilus assembly protein TadD
LSHRGAGIIGTAVAEREEKLESWKEIAAYLGRSPRTVQRWERLEGLPVHRLQHDKLGSVYAYRSELDAWWEARRTTLGSAEPEPEEEEAAAAEAPAGAQPPAVAMALRRWVLLAFAILLVSLGLYFSATIRRVEEPRRATRLAVIPFANLTGDDAQEFLSDGLTEEMIAELGRLPELGVIARTSVMRYKKTEKPIAEIGRELRVDYVLEGSVRQAEKRVRVTAQLIRVSDEVHVWAESYDREGPDVIGIERQIARRVAEETRLRTTAASERDVDTDAQVAYLRGRFFWNRRTEEGFKEGLVHFRHAVDKDPEWARAWTGIADSYMLMGNYGFLPVAEAAPKAKEAAERAIALDARLAEAHASLGLVFASTDWDFPRAEQEFRRAFELNPSLASARLWYGLMLVDLDRVAEARGQFRLGLEADPLSEALSGQLGNCDFQEGRYAEALAEEKSAAEASPDRPNPHISLTRVYLALGRYEEAVASAETARRLSQEHPSVMGLYAYALARAGRTAEARAVLDKLVAESKSRPVRPFDLALAATGVGDHDRAIAWLGQMVDERHVGARGLAVSPEFASLRGDPRFEALLVRVGLKKPA